MAAADKPPEKPIELWSTIPISDITSVTRYNDWPITDANKEKEYTLTDLFEDWENFKVVTKTQYIIVSYGSMNLSGKVTIKDHGTYFWEMHPGISGVLRDASGGEMFLLHDKYLKNWRKPSS